MPKNLVISYVNPDLDGASCTVARAELLAKEGVVADMGLLGEPLAEVLFMFSYLGLKMPEIFPDARGYENIYLMDVSELHMLEGRVPAEKVVEIVDHRKVNDLAKFPNAKAQVELVGAAATLVAERFKKAGFAPSKSTAALLYGAIVSNTLNFKSQITTDRDRKMAEWLREISGLSADFWKELYAAKSDLSGEKLREAIISDSAWWRFKQGSIVMGQLEIMGVQKLLFEREAEVLRVLEELRAMEKVDHSVLNGLDIGEGRTFFVAGDPATRELCTRVLGMKFSGNIAICEGLTLRKLILPKLKAALDV